RLGAEIVESKDPLYPDDPDVPNMTYTFQDAMSEILPLQAPEIFFQQGKTGEPDFAVPGWDVRTIDYDVALSLKKAPLSDKLNLRSISMAKLTNPNILLNIDKYLAERGDARVKDWASWVANAKFRSDQERADAENLLTAKDPRTNGEVPSYLRMQSVFR